MKLHMNAAALFKNVIYTVYTICLQVSLSERGGGYHGACMYVCTLFLLDYFFKDLDHP